MQGPLAQMVALTCHGNAAIRGIAPSQFPMTHSTCQFCETVKFIARNGLKDGSAETITLADSPDAWIGNLTKRGIAGLRLLQRDRNAPGISDRKSAGFVGGGRQWRIEGIRQIGTVEEWLSKWEVGDRNAPDRRLWRVTYGLCNLHPDAPVVLRPLSDLVVNLRNAIGDTIAFASQNGCAGFIPSFDNAMKALVDPAADIGYHKDLFPPGSLSFEAISLLKAAQSAWVFGGMGSWNDGMSFNGELGREYDRVSENLFDVLNEAIEAAATSSMDLGSDSAP